jgi:hypothetical protein
MIYYNIFQIRSSLEFLIPPIKKTPVRHEYLSKSRILTARDHSVPVNIISYASAFAALLNEAKFVKAAQFHDL